MPNWCTNNLTVSGDDSDIQQFLDQNTTPEGHLSFELAVPLPDDPTIDDVRQIWGTKWDLDDEQSLTRSNAACVFDFDTAWSPPLRWLEVVAPQFPQLVFVLAWDEPGMYFGGITAYIKGEQTGIEEGGSRTMVYCAAPNCDSDSLGVLSLEEAWINPPAEPIVEFCRDHELERAAHEAESEVASEDTANGG